MSNSEPEIQCSLKPWMLDISYVCQVEEFVRNHHTLTLYERWPIWFLPRNTDPKEIVQNHLDYIRDVLSTTAYLIDERRRRNWRWTMLSIYSRMMREKRK